MRQSNHPSPPRCTARLAFQRKQSSRHERPRSRRLHRLAGDIAALGVRTEATVLDGEVATSLAEHFRTTGVDLIVMTTHDRGRLEHLLMGSVAEAVTRKAHIPALVVRPSTGPASFEPPAIEHMLIPLDGSDFAEAILPHASTLARADAHADSRCSPFSSPSWRYATAALDAGPDPVTPLPGVPNGVAHGEVRAPELERAAAILRSSSERAGGDCRSFRRPSCASDRRLR